MNWLRHAIVVRFYQGERGFDAITPLDTPPRVSYNASSASFYLDFQPAQFLSRINIPRQQERVGSSPMAEREAKKPRPRTHTRGEEMPRRQSWQQKPVHLHSQG